MRVRASLSAAAALSAAAIVVACGLDMGGLDTGGGDGGSSSGATSSGTTSGSGGSSGATSSSGIGSSSGTSSGSGSGSSSGTTSSSGAGDASIDSTTPVDAQQDSTSPPDTSTQDVVVADTTPPQETGGGCAAASGCYVIPGGWIPVVLATTQASPCPSGFANAAPSDVVEGPNTSAACACQCSVTSPPSCESGAISTKFDIQGQLGAGQCGLTGSPAQMANAGPGACDTDMYQGGNGGGIPPQPSYKTLDLEYTPTDKPTGGACQQSSVPTGNITYASKDRSCTPDSPASAGCTGNQCAPSVAAPYKFCIEQGGNHTCPPGPFTQAHVVGDSVSLQCSGGCGCTTTGTCSGGTLKLFTDDKCSNGELDVPADGQCHASNATSDTYKSYKYVANAATNPTCTNTGSTSAQNVNLVNTQTVCCLP